MYQKIRITVVSLVVMSVCILSSVMTLSYFTDTDTSSNEFTVGNASTSLAVYDDISGETKRVFDAANYSPLVDRDIPFYLQATNDGNIPVYQRFRVVIPIALAEYVKLNLPTNCEVETATNYICASNDYTITYNPSVSVEETPTYAEYYIVSNRELAVDAKTIEWPTEKLVFTGISDAEKSLFTCTNNDNNNCVLGLNIYSDAIQTTGFANANEAFTNLAETY